MRNSIKLLVLAAIAIAAVSCESKPSTMSYTLAGTFSYVADNPDAFPLIDSVYYNKHMMLDNFSALCASCIDKNSGFSGGWRISVRKGGSDQSSDQQILSSAGKYAGYSDPNKGVFNKAYAVYWPSSLKEDILFDYKSNFSKSTCYVSGFYINNTKFVETLAANDGIADGNYLKVTATFLKNDIPVANEEFYLVDYRGAEKKIVKDWTVWEMKEARKWDVDAIKFDVASAGASLPLAFCLDVFVASVAVEY